MPGNIKYALVLTGGGFKGAFQLGVLNYLNDHWKRITGQVQMRFDIITGCSAGSLNGCFVAMNKLHDLNTFWDTVAEKGVEELLTSKLLTVQESPGQEGSTGEPDLSAKPGMGETLGMLVSRARRQKFVDDTISRLEDNARQKLNHVTALTDYSPLLAKLRRHVNMQHIVPGTHFYTGFTSLHDGNFYHLPHTDFDDNEEFIKAVLAGIVLPVVCEPVKMIRTRYHTIYHSVDGSLANTAPIGNVISLIRADTDSDAEYRIIIVNCSTAIPEKGSALPGYTISHAAMRLTHEITAAGIFRKDLKAFQHYNYLALHNDGRPLYTNNPYSEAAAAVHPVKAFSYNIIQAGLPAGNDITETNMIDRQILHGWQQAARAFEAGKENGGFTF